MFWYFDAMGSAADEIGAVLRPNEIRGIPKDYDLKVFDPLPSLFSAHCIMTSERMWLQKVVVVENLKDSGVAILTRHYTDKQLALKIADDPEKLAKEKKNGTTYASNLLLADELHATLLPLTDSHLHCK